MSSWLLEQTLIVTGQEARETGAEQARAFDRERPSARRVQLGELQSTSVAAGELEEFVLRLEESGSA
jgi:hypothetical protein